MFAWHGVLVLMSMVTFVQTCILSTLYATASVALCCWNNLNLPNIRTCNFLLVIHINFARISYRFQDIDCSLFSPPSCLTALSEECHAIPTYSRHRWIGPSRWLSIRLAVIGFWICKILREFEVSWSRTRSSILVSIESALCDFLNFCPLPIEHCLTRIQAVARIADHTTSQHTTCI